MIAHIHRASAWAGLLALLACAGCFESRQEEASARGEDIQHPGLEELARHIEGAVVYEAGGDLYVQPIGTDGGKRRLAKNGRYPRWAPDGRHVAFVRDRSILRIAADGSGETELAKAGEPRAVACHPNDREILFTDGKAIRSVSIRGGSVRTLASGHTFRELDVSADGTRLVATIRGLGLHVRAYDLAAGRDWKISDGCSASLSPDAQLVSNNSGDHRRLLLRRWENGKEERSIDAPAGLRFDNQFWSNHPDWILSIAEDGPADVFVHSVSANSAYRITSGGGCERADLYVKTAP